MRFLPAANRSRSTRSNTRLNSTPSTFMPPPTIRSTNSESPRRLATRNSAPAKPVSNTTQEQDEDERMRLKQQAEHERMMSLYRQHVLGEKPVAGSFVPLASIAPASPRARVTRRKRRPV